MTVTITCPGTRWRHPGKYIGHDVQCPECGGWARYIPDFGLAEHQTSTYRDPDNDELIPLETRNEELGLTVAEILALPPCACGHEAVDHLPDGILGAGGRCEWLLGDRNCWCSGYREYQPDDDVPEDVPDWWEA